MTLKFENQGPLNDWPSVTRADGTLLARFYGPDAEGQARKMVDLDDRSGEDTAHREMRALSERDAMLALVRQIAAGAPARDAWITQARAILKDMGE